ncbi:MAG TPA: hypothetical protein VFD49_07275 [Candidatus Dormibacteraeota bacterium]|nr:hypothetical protein [Candidatus Dormibacteraeota bacterium]
MTASLAVKLLLTPALIAAASLVARRWGARVAGWLVGFPFTSGPVALVLVLDHGRRFAAAAAVGTLLGVLSQAAFAVAYVRVARRLGWPACLAAGTLAFAGSTLALAHVGASPPVAAGLVVAGLSLALAVTPSPARPERGGRPPAWDLPARMLVATAFVLVITALASRLGPGLTGLLTPFPLYATVLGVFAHLHDGRESASAVMRGLLTGLYGFGAFFLALSLLLVSGGPALAFAGAIAAVALVQALALALGRERAG